jgi:hypothetical protein
VAKVTNAAVSYSQVGLREDLANAIYNIDPFDTPFMTLAGRRSVSQRTFDWQVESLPAVNGSNAEVEGFELSRAAATFTSRVNNNTQISYRDATVAGSAEDGNNAGKGKGEMAHQMALASKALKRDMETILLSKQPRVVGADGTARKTRGFEHFITTNVTYGGSAVAAASETAAITDGTPRAFTESLLLSTLQTAWTAGSEPSELFLGGSNKRVFSGFTGRAVSQVLVGKSEVTNSVDIYASDFGRIKARATRWQRAQTALLIDPSYVKVCYFRSFKTMDIARIGDAETKMILVEYGLEVSNEKAHAKIADLTTP